MTITPAQTDCLHVVVHAQEAIPTIVVHRYRKNASQSIGSTGRTLKSLVKLGLVAMSSRSGKRYWEATK